MFSFENLEVTDTGALVAGFCLGSDPGIGTLFSTLGNGAGFG